jgi:hypothetical protein
MRRFRNRQSSIEVALANFSLTFAKALLVLCVVLFMLINPKNGTDGVKPNAEFLITIDWQVVGRYDVDLWTRLPNGSIVSYLNKESGVVFLERDDLGQDCNLTTNAGKSTGICQEITSIRGVLPGEYEVSVHLYSANSVGTPAPVEPVTVHVVIHKLNPDTTIVWQGTVILDTIREEKPMVRFTINADASITDLQTDDLPPVVYAPRTRIDDDARIND